MNCICSTPGTHTFPSPGDCPDPCSTAGFAARLSQGIAMVSRRDCCWTIEPGSHSKYWGIVVSSKFFEGELLPEYQLNLL
jgi:hypothetical protein